MELTCWWNQLWIIFMNMKSITAAAHSIWFFSFLFSLRMGREIEKEFKLKGSAAKEWNGVWVWSSALLAGRLWAGGQPAQGAQREDERRQTNSNGMEPNASLSFHLQSQWSKWRKKEWRKRGMKLGLACSFLCGLRAGPPATAPQREENTSQQSKRNVINCFFWLMDEMRDKWAWLEWNPMNQ